MLKTSGSMGDSVTVTKPLWILPKRSVQVMLGKASMAAVMSATSLGPSSLSGIETVVAGLAGGGPGGLSARIGFLKVSLNDPAPIRYGTVSDCTWVVAVLKR